MSVTVSASALDNLKTTLETNLPILIQVAAHAKFAGNAGANIASATTDFVSKLSATNAACNSVKADVAAGVSAEALAAVNVSAAFSASTSVTARATAGSG